MITNGDKFGRMWKKGIATCFKIRVETEEDLDMNDKHHSKMFGFYHTTSFCIKF
jgi:hypothetical protein